MKVIQVEIANDFVKKSSKNAGVQGEANATDLHIKFGEEWSQYSKRIVWRDAKGENPVVVILSNTVDGVIDDGMSSVSYVTSIPGEPLSVPGWCNFTIEGYLSYDSSYDRVMFSVTDYLYVKPNDTDYQPIEPTPTQAQQLQSVLDDVVDQVSSHISSAEVWTDEWDPTFQYERNNKTYCRGSSYLCLVKNIARDPEFSVAGGEPYWQLIAKEGEQGIEGAEGRMGPQGPQGIHGTLVETEGMYGFRVDENGMLIISYTGDEAPNFELKENGDLVLIV